MKNGKAIKSEKTELEKQAPGVLAAVSIMWKQQDARAQLCDWLHGAAMIQPWEKQELADELGFLREVARARK